MLNNTEIVQQPLFYLFLVFSLLLSVGYFWGRRKNIMLCRTVLQEITDKLRPHDQVFTNIGGLTGFHANFIPRDKHAMRRIDFTFTLLPRQSWLYLPISMATVRNDKLFVTFFPTQRIPMGVSQAHLIEHRFNHSAHGRINDQNMFEEKHVQWGGGKYIMYTKDVSTQHLFKQLITLLPQPGYVRHIAILPEDRKIYVFLIPHMHQAAKEIFAIYKWVLALWMQQAIDDQKGLKK